MVRYHKGMEYSLRKPTLNIFNDLLQTWRISDLTLHHMPSTFSCGVIDVILTSRSAKLSPKSSRSRQFQHEKYDSFTLFI